MKHITILEPGRFLGIEGERLIVSKSGETLAEFPLNRLKSVQILQRGVSFSSNLLSQCAARGIKFFIIDYRGRNIACLSGMHQHAVVELRKKQFAYLDSAECREMARGLVYGKIRNQRTVLLYFHKYEKDRNPAGERLSIAAEKIRGIANTVKTINPGVDWRSVLMGYEGNAAALYWASLAETQLLGAGFQGRSGRGADDAANQALNLGYAILQSYIWNALANAGLEVYAGLFHTDRPGKPSLVLDLMEEFRPWVVDRVAIKKRHLLATDSLSEKARKSIIAEIHETMATKYPVERKRYRLESIVQKQAYRMAGVFVRNQNYRPYLFRW